MGRNIILALLLLSMVPGSLALTLVVGGCARGDYEYNTLWEALEAAEGHTDVNIYICGSQELELSKTIHVGDITINGGEITSNERKITIYGDDVVLRDVNFHYTRVYVVATGDVHLQHVWADMPADWRYCIDVNAQGDVTVDGVHVSGCEYGLYVERADDLNVWEVYTDGSTVAIYFDPQRVDRVFLNPIKVIEEHIVEKIVEKNVPVLEIVYRVPPELQKELDSCRELVGILQEKKSRCENELTQCKVELSKTRSASPYPDPWVAIGILVLGTVAGYLLGRI